MMKFGLLFCLGLSHLCDDFLDIGISPSPNTQVNCLFMTAVYQTVDMWTYTYCFTIHLTNG